MGEPDVRQKIGDKEEKWLYYKVNRSLLRKTPFLGPHIGTQDYDVVIINFSGKRVSACMYRVMDEEEFQELELRGVKDSGK